MLELYEKFRSLLKTSSAVKLMRARHAPLILSFLYREFKEKQQLTVSNHELISNLADCLEDLGLADDEDKQPAGNENCTERARRYIDEWCNKENSYLRKYPDTNGLPVHELTRGTEKALQWIESMEKKAFVGTESRFLDIFGKLRELIERSLEDPQQRIADLEAKKARIEAQIREIKVSGRAEVFSDTQIKERFYEVNKLGRDLISDFKEVEDNFLDISQKIYRQQTRQDLSKGAILGYTLDATDDLKASDQGRSFYAFWSFLISDARQEELNQLVDQTFDLLEQREIPDKDAFLRHIKSYLFQAGQKVMKSNRRMVDRLSRVLNETSFRERQKILEMISNIRSLAIDCMDSPPDIKDFIEIDDGCDIKLVMDRPLGRKPQAATFDRQPEEMGGADFNTEDLEVLFDRFEIDKAGLEENIKTFLHKQNQVTLEEILETYPLKQGLAEIITYLSIASSSPGHIILEDKTVRIKWSEDETRKVISMPRVIYTQ